MTLDVTMPWCTWFKHHPKDFALETGHFRPEEVGAYVRLRDHYWANNAVLPEDESLLARIAGISDEQWPKVRVMLLTLFKVKDGVWTHPRLDEALSVSKVSYETKSANGKKGAQAKRKGGLSPASTGLKQTEPDSESEPDSSIEEPPYSPPPGDGCSDDFEKFWEAYPSKKGKDAAWKAFKSTAKNGVSLEALQAGIERYKRSKPEGLQYCNPAKWLREGRWKDELPASESSDCPKPDAGRDWETRLSVYKLGGYWHADWGPRPEEEGCKAPQSLVNAWSERQEMEIPSFLKRKEIIR